MKTYMGILFFIVAAFAVAECFPRAQEEDVVVVPLGKNMDSDEASSEESGESFYVPPLYPVSWFNGFDAFMRNIANRLKGLISSGPSPDWGKVTNATSTKKVIDGHVVTINDTTYTKEGNDTDSVFFVRVIDIKPSELNTEENVPEPGPEVETLDDGKSEASNEISKGQTEERAELLERREFFPDYNYDLDVDNAIDVFDTKPISLEGDIRVNKVRHDQTKGGIFMVPHDVEVFDVEDGKPVYSYNPYHPYQISQRSEKIFT